MAYLTVLIFSLVLTGTLMTGRFAIPFITFGLRPSSLRTWFVESAQGQRLIDSRADWQEHITALKALGFRLLGVKAEKFPLWGPVALEIALAEPATHTYASFVCAPQGRPQPFYFYTPCRDGGLVFTDNHHLTAPFENPAESVRRVESNDPEQIYRAHLEHIQQRPAAARQMLSAGGQEARLEATHKFYESAYGRQVARQYLGLWPVRAFAAMLVLLLLLLAYAAFSLAG